MALIWLAVIGAAGFIALGLLVYALMQWEQEKEKTERLELKLDHVQQMVREQRDYDDIMAYAERDAADLTDDPDAAVRTDRLEGHDQR